MQRDRSRSEFISCMYVGVTGEIDGWIDGQTNTRRYSTKDDKTRAATEGLLL